MKKHISRLLQVAFLLWSVAFTSSLYAYANCETQNDVYKRAGRLFDEGNYLLSNLQFSLALSLNCDKSLNEKSHWGYAATLFRLNETSSSLNEINRATQLYKTPGITRKFNLLKLEIDAGFIDSVSTRDKQKYLLWKNRYKKKNWDHLDISELTAGEKVAFDNFHASASKINFKNPWASGILSAIIPGAGHAYLGSWQSATLSFLLNGLFLATTLEFARKNMNAAAIASGFIFSVTYSGNILSAVDGTNKYNNSLSRNLDTKYHRELFPDLYP